MIYLDNYGQLMTNNVVMILRFIRFIKIYNNIAETNPYTFNSLCCGNFGQVRFYTFYQDFSYIVISFYEYLH